MVGARFGRALGALAVTALAMVPVALGAFTAPAGATGAVTAGTAAALNSEWQDGSNTSITLTANITISGADCVGGAQRSTGGGITVDGQGLYGITSSCAPGGRILYDSSSEAVTLTGLTHFDGGNVCDSGGGLFAVGSVTATNSSFSNDVASFGGCQCGTSTALVVCGAGSKELHSSFVAADGGAIFSLADVTLTNATFTSNHADFSGGAVFAVGDATVTDSTFTTNSAGMSGELEEYVSGGALAALGTVTVNGSSFDGNWIGDAKGDLCSVCAPSGGAIANGVIGVGSAVPSAPAMTITGTTFTDNHADCVYYCLSGGGAVHGMGVVTTASSTFTGNTTNISNCTAHGAAECYDFGGALWAPSLTDTGSTFNGNHADAAGCSHNACWNEGGAIATNDLSLTGTGVADNTAACDDDCASYGGGVAAGQLAAEIPTSAEAAASWSAGAPHAAITPSGVVTITQSNFSGNSASCQTTFCGVTGGGALLFEPTSATVTASTFSGNSAQYAGALGVFDETGVPVSLVNSTVTGNSSSWEGALGFGGSDASLAYDTIVGNSVVAPPPDALPESASASPWGQVHGAGSPPVVANLSGATATTFGTIVALPQGAPNCQIGSGTSQGYNWSDDTSCAFTDATDKVATPNDPQLNALGAWGGPTPTMLPDTPKNGGVTSPVIDAIPAAACQTGVAAGITTDQRGVTRPQLFGCDIGAVEVSLQDYQVEAAVVIQPKFTG